MMATNSIPNGGLVRPQSGDTRQAPQQTARPSLARAHAWRPPLAMAVYFHALEGRA